VLVDGAPVLSCQTHLEDVAGRSITTIEGLADGGRLHPVQRALVDEGASQCGYCTPGMALRGAALLSADPDPDDRRTAEALGPSLCRCGCYVRIARAVQRAAALLRQPGRDALELPAEEGPPVEPRLGRPRKPWDLCEPSEREWFDLLGDGLVVVWPPEAGPSGLLPAGGGAWLHLAPDGVVTAFSGKVDVGQDNRTALRLLAAEELGVEVEDVRVVLGDTDLCPFDRGTFGSLSMPEAGETMRRLAAGARHVLVSLAAQHRNRNGGRVSTGIGAAAGDPGGSRQGWAELLAGMRRVEVITAEPSLIAPDAWTVAGRPGHRPSRLDVVTGTRRYVSDLDRPGMLHGAVLRPPVPGSTLCRVDPAPAEQLSGVTIVQDGEFVAAVAGDPMTARLAVDAIAATWVPSPPGPCDLADHLRSHPVAGEGWHRAVDDAVGDVEAALADAATRLDATYTTSFIAHAPLETRAAVAEWDDGRLTVWTGTQVPFGVRAELAGTFGLDEADVRVIVPPTGSCFGGKHRVEAAAEAARLSRAVGRPVKVHWNRAEEFTWGYLRPMAVIDVRAGVDTDGALTAWDFLDVNAGAAGIGFPYVVANRRLRYQPAASPVSQGSYRALAATANHFARESHIDDLATAAGADPLEFRLRHLDDERLATVVGTAADRFGWSTPGGSSGAGKGFGIAAGLEKNGRVATCAEVLVDTGERVRLTRLVVAYECGAVVNPDTVVNQIEGGVVMALGGALFEQIAIVQGRLAHPGLASYRVPRFGDIPALEVVLLDRPDIPSAGAGETPLVAVAPAIANAIFDATGRRIRSLPLTSVSDGDVRHAVNHRNEPADPMAVRIVAMGPST
jgi:isoquinoline 1-oxidoreductase